MVEEQDADPVVTFDWTRFDSPCTAVVTAVAEAADADPATIGPVYEVVDPDALDTFVASMSYPQGSPNARIEFVYQDYRVLIKANGWGYVYDRDDSPQSTAAARTFEASKQVD